MIGECNPRNNMSSKSYENDGGHCAFSFMLVIHRQLPANMYE